MRVGVIGKGYGERVVAKAFSSVEGCEVVDVVTPRDDAAVTALCGRADVDLISVQSPPFMHLDHVRLAVEAGHAVLCDKPFGRNAQDAKAMVAMADEAGVLGFLNCEMRFDDTRQKVRELVMGGAIGQPEHVEQTMLMSMWRVPLRNFGWLNDASLGGGWFRSLGSHFIDYMRWMFGEVTEASGQLRTAIPERPDADGKLRTCTSDDGFVATLRLASGVTSVIDSSAVAPLNLPPSQIVAGSTGVIQVVAESRVTLHTEGGAEEVFVSNAGANSLYTAQALYAAAIRDAVHAGTAPDGLPMFADGLACVEVLDRVIG